MCVSTDEWIFRTLAVQNVLICELAGALQTSGRTFQYWIEPCISDHKHEYIANKREEYKMIGQLAAFSRADVVEFASLWRGEAPLPGSIMRIGRFATDRQGIMEGDNSFVMADDLPRPYPHWSGLVQAMLWPTWEADGGIWNSPKQFSDSEAVAIHAPKEAVQMQTLKRSEQMFFLNWCLRRPLTEWVLRDVEF